MCRQERDAAFLKQQMFKTDPSNEKCLTSCIIKKLNRQALIGNGKNNKIKFECKFYLLLTWVYSSINFSQIQEQFCQKTKNLTQGQVLIFVST